MGECCGQPSCAAVDQGYCAAAGDVDAGASSRMDGSLLHGGAGEETSHDGGGAADRPGEAVAVDAGLSRKSCAGALAACVAAELDGDWKAQRGFDRCEDETLEPRAQHCDLGRGP